MSTRISQIVFWRGKVLYGAIIDTGKLSEPRWLADVSAMIPGDGELLWAVSPDSRHVAFKGEVPPTLRSDDPYISPQAFYIAALSRTAGVERKGRLLVCTADLRDAHGQKVTTFSPFARLPHQSKSYPLPDDQIDGGWTIGSLRWSNRGDRLYVSLRWGNTLGGEATCAVDARTGKAITDATGKWHRLLPTFNIDENRDGLLVGCGLGRTHDEPNVCNACSRYRPLYVATNTHTTPTSLLPGRFNSKNKPEYGFARSCALSPEGRRIAFVSKNQLWLTAVNSLRYTRLLASPHSELHLGDIAWPGEHVLIYHQYKFTKSGNTWQKTGNLWHLPLTAGGRVAAKPILFLDNVEDFALLPG